MNKFKRIVIILGAAIILEIIAMLFFPGKKTPTITPPATTPHAQQPFFYHLPKKSDIAVVSSKPADQEKNVSLTGAISVQFNKPISQSTVAISFVPSFPFQTKIINNTLIVSPTQPLFPNIGYYGFVTINGVPSYNFQFATVIDKTQTTPPDFTNDIQTELNKHNYPDVYLAGFTPYTTSSFTVISNYTTDTPEHFFFVITLFSDKTQATQDFINWATATGLTKEQLDTMDIRYN